MNTSNNFAVFETNNHLSILESSWSLIWRNKPIGANDDPWCILILILLFSKPGRENAAECMEFIFSRLIHLRIYCHLLIISVTTISSEFYTLCWRLQWIWHFVFLQKYLEPLKATDNANLLEPSLVEEIFHQVSIEKVLEMVW